VILLPSLALAAEPQDCTPTLSAATGDSGWSIVLDAPCRPYLDVALVLGPVTIPEQTGPEGKLTLDLPHLPGATEVVARGEGLDLSAALPDLSGAPAATVIIPVDGRQPGILPPLGFPAADGMPRPEAAVAAAPAETLDLPVTDANCAAPRDFVVLPGRDVPVSVDVPPPGCTAPPAFLRLPLPH